MDTEQVEPNTASVFAASVSIVPGCVIDNELEAILRILTASGAIEPVDILNSTITVN